MTKLTLASPAAPSAPARTTTASTRPLVLDGRNERLESPFNAPRITPRVGDVYRVSSQMHVGGGKTVRVGVLGQVVALGPNGDLSIELPFTRASGAGASDPHAFESGVDTFKLREREWQRNGQIILGGLDARITPTPSEIAPPAGPYVAPLPQRTRQYSPPEIAGHPRRNRRKLG